MSFYVCYLIIHGLILFIAGAMEYADSPIVAQTVGLITIAMGSYVAGIRHERGKW
jgi:uncharacterized membrane-anchored protein